MSKKSIISATCSCLAVVSFSANSALISRLGGQAYYDTILDITWLADTNYALDNQFGLTLSDNIFDDTANTIGSDGRTTWSNAHTWIAGMNTANHLGYNDWRLPMMMDTANPGCDGAYGGTDCGYNVQTGSAATTVYSEIASLYFDTLGNISYQDTSGNEQSGYGFVNTGPFSVAQESVYWTGLEYAPSALFAWVFETEFGRQSAGLVDGSFYAWAVRSGDVSSVPVPAAAWLFGSGLICLIGFAKQKVQSNIAAVIVTVIRKSICGAKTRAGTPCKRRDLYRS